jgi:hypothetical protein
MVRALRIMWILVRYETTLFPPRCMLLYPIPKPPMPDVRDAAVLKLIAGVNDNKPAGSLKQRPHIGLKDFIFNQVINNIERKHEIETPETLRNSTYPMPLNNFLNVGASSLAVQQMTTKQLVRIAPILHHPAFLSFFVCLV